MKKILIFAVVLSLLVPAAAFAATEFSLGGYIKLDTYWDTTQQGKNINGVIARDNDTNFHHGNFRMTAQGSRFNFTIKGPEVLGAKLTGFIEMDFDSCTDVGSVSNAPGGQSASNSYVPRMRHAMFRLNWPGETELIFGQYWSMFCDWFPEVAEDGPFQLTGIPTARLPQIRFTQGFACDWKVAGLVGMPNGYSEFGTGGALGGAATTGSSMNPYGTTTTSGGCAETPQIQGQLKYAHDWWGKAAFYGNPIPFTASVTAGYQRLVMRNGGGFVTAPLAIAPVNASTTAAALGPYGLGDYMAHTYLSPWMVQGSFFIPIIPTHTNDLTGTAHLLVQPWIGQGVNQFGMTGDSTGVFKLAGYYPGTHGVALVDEELVKRFGLLAEAQYYFNNQWFMNVAYGITAAMSVNQNNVNVPGYGPIQQMSYNNPYNQVRMVQQLDATLWYQPVKALKFGIQYSYLYEQFVADAFPGTNGAYNEFTNTAGWSTNQAHEHRVEFVGFFFF